MRLKEAKKPTDQDFSPPSSSVLGHFLFSPQMVIASLLRKSDYLAFLSGAVQHPNGFLFCLCIAIRLRLPYRHLFLSEKLTKELLSMHMHSLNWLAILLAAISTMLLGFLWYSPLLFAKAWTREMGYDPNDKSKMDEMRRNAGPAYAGSFVAGLLSAVTLALILHGMRAESVHFGMMASFHIWLGFVATVQFTGALFAKQSMKLFAINTGYQLVCYLVMGAILVLWK